MRFFIEFVILTEFVIIHIYTYPSISFYGANVLRVNSIRHTLLPFNGLTVNYIIRPGPSTNRLYLFLYFYLARWYLNTGIPSPWLVSRFSYFTASSPITCLMDGILRRSWSVWLEIYQGALVTIRRVFGWKVGRIVVLDGFFKTIFRLVVSLVIVAAL